MIRVDLNSGNPRIGVGLLVKAGLLSLLAFGSPLTLTGQDETESSRREAEAIKQVEASGGRVYRISAADTSREVSFYLSSKPIGDEQLKDIGAIGNVIWVNLAGTEISNEGLKHLAGMPIQKLHLERTKIGDDGLVHLKPFKDMTYLNLYDTKVTDAGLEHLKDLKKLEKLFVWKSGVTEEGMRKLNESLPDLQIVGELKLEPVVIEEPKKEEPPKPEDQPEEPKKKAGKKKAGNKKAGSKQADPKKEQAKPEAAKTEDKKK